MDGSDTKTNNLVVSEKDIKNLFPGKAIQFPECHDKTFVALCKDDWINVSSPMLEDAMNYNFIRLFVISDCYLWIQNRRYKFLFYRC